MQAVVDGTWRCYSVKHVFYHPGLERKFDKGFFVRSDDPQDGEVASHSPDLAVVELSALDRDLPVQCTLASDAEVSLLRGQDIGLLGYPANVEDRWPTAQRLARATLMTSVVAKMVDRPVNAGASGSRYTRVHYNLDAPHDGMSGAPVFLQNGHVAAIYTSYVSGELSPNVGARVDFLRDLLVYHGLMGSTRAEFEQARSLRDWGNDPHLAEFRRAAKLVRGAERLRRVGDYHAALAACNEVVNLAPKYVSALLERSKVYLYFIGHNWNDLTRENRGRYAKWARSDAVRCIANDPEWNAPYLICAQIDIYIAVLESEADGLRNIIKSINKMLGPNWIAGALSESERAFAINCRAQCYHFLGELEHAETDYAESIRIDPDEPTWHFNRAQFRKQAKDDARADDDWHNGLAARKRRIHLD